MILLLGVLITVVVLLVFLVWKALDWAWLKPMRLQRYLEKQGIKGHRYQLLFGNLKELIHLTKEAQSKPMKLSHSILPRALPFDHQIAQEYGKVFVTWFGVTPRVNIMDPLLIKEIFSNKFGHFSKVKPNPLINLLADGVFSHNDEKWVKHRGIINPAFHLEKLKMMVPAFCTSCHEMVTRWDKLVLEGSCELDVCHDILNLTGDVISRVGFGSSYEEARRIFELQNEQVEHVMQVIQSIYFPGLWYLPTKRNKRMKEISREVKTILEDMINKREKAMKNGEASKDDLLSLLLDSNFKKVQEHGNSKNVGLTINEIIEECKLLYFAGQETASSLLMWIMVVLGAHQDWQAQARNEVLQVFGRNKPDFEGSNRLSIVTMIIYEVLRLYPPVAMLLRYNYKEMRLGNISLPPGIQIGIPALLVHHDHDLWGEDAEEFKPERFSEGISKATRNHLSFFPFGWGLRICVGHAFAMLETKIALAMILQRFSFELSPSYAHAPHCLITTLPQYGVQIILHKL